MTGVAPVAGTSMPHKNPGETRGICTHYPPGCFFVDIGSPGWAVQVPDLADHVCRCCSRHYFIGQISLPDAARSINLDVMVFLFGMFIVGEALAESGYLVAFSQHLVSHCRNFWQFIVIFVFSMAFLAAFLMNDTMAIIGTPLALYLGRRLGFSVKMLLVSLCFAITTGSVMSPIGNPQNLLIATEGGYANPFGTFLLYLGIPTIISLVLLVLCIRFFYPQDCGKCICMTEEVNIKGGQLPDPELPVFKISLFSYRILYYFAGPANSASFRPNSVMYRYLS